MLQKSQELVVSDEVVEEEEDSDREREELKEESPVNLSVARLVSQIPSEKRELRLFEIRQHQKLSN